MEVGSAEDLEDWFKTLSEEQYRGQTLLIRLPAGEYSLTTTLSLDQLAGVSSLSILGDPSGGGTTLVAAPGSTLLATSPGAPPLKLSGLTLRGPVRIDGSRAEISSCAFEKGAADAGYALAVAGGGTLAVFGAKFAGNRGAVLVDDAEAELARCRFVDNQAPADGGGGSAIRVLSARGDGVLLRESRDFCVARSCLSLFEPF